MRAPALALLLAACVSAKLPNSTPEWGNEPAEVAKVVKREAAEVVKPEEDSIEEVNVKSGVAGALFQGDIVLTKEQQQLVASVREARAKRQAFNDKGTWLARKWTDGLTFILADYLDETTKTAFRKAAKLWEEDTCINITEYQWQPSKRVKPPKDFLIVEGGNDGCKSYVGRKKEEGPQNLTLGVGCGTIGHAAHEIGHALGLFHTHARYDRDEFIKVHKANIESEWHDQFDPQTKDTNYNYNLTYDYGSIMHYAAKSLVAVDEDEPVMEALDGNYTEALGSDIIAFYDLLMMNMLYSCTDKCKDENTKCLNDGFPHPRDCSKCICPSGYGGLFCEKRPEGCGDEVDAKEEWQTLEYKLDGSDAGKERDGFKRCTYWIKAPSDKKVEVEIVALPDIYADNGCKHSGLEIKAHSDKRLTGYRFCSKEDVKKILVSHSNLVPVITYNRLNLGVNTKLRYHYV